MSDRAQAASLGAPGGAGTNPWLIAILVAVASFMETLDTTIANVLLNYIAGGLGSARTRRPGW
jgi:DHA2 family multidrug resistance protein